MTKTFDVAEGVRLPLAWMTLASVVYGARGSGKTTFGSVAAEQIHGAGQRFCVIDPKADWWGLKATADGEGPGIPLVVFGGDHADLPLTATSGELIAGLVVDMAESVVLDLEHLKKGQQLRFVAEFLEALYQQNRDPLLVLVDEAQRYAPQNVRDAQKNDGYATRCLGACEDIVKLGRKHGLGIVLFTQRGAGLNKECSELCDMMVAFRTPGTIDLGRVKDWLGSNATADQAKAALDVLSGLDTGTAVFASNHPQLRLFEIAPVRRRWTFDSAATPEPGRRQREPRMLAMADIDRLRGMLSEQQDEIEANDPGKLKARVADLEKQLAAAREKAEMPADVQPPEPVPFVPAEAVSAIGLLAERLATTSDAVDAALGHLASVVAEKRTSVAALFTMLDGDVEKAAAVLDPFAVGMAATAGMPGSYTLGREVGNSLPREPDHEPGVRELPREREGIPPGDGTVTFTEAHQRILDALAWADSVGLVPIDRAQLALLAGASATSGAYKGNLAGLKVLEMVDYPTAGRVAPLPAGLAQAGPPPPIRTSEQLQEAVCRRLPEAQARIVRALVGVYPQTLTRPDLADRVGASVTSGAFKGDVAALKTLGLAEYPSTGLVKATGALFLAGR